MLVLKWAQTAKDKEMCFSVREAVFIKEQGFQGEFDAIDEVACHLLAMEDGVPVGTARLFLDAGRYTVGRICLLPQARGSGYGRAMMEAIETKARLLGADRIYLGAQLRARGFYARLGYQTEGDEFLDEYCPHIRMFKELKPSYR